MLADVAIRLDLMLEKDTNDDKAARKEDNNGDNVGQGPPLRVGCRQELANRKATQASRGVRRRVCTG